jgi:hypothetical protein
VPKLHYINGDDNKGRGVIMAFEKCNTLSDKLAKMAVCDGTLSFDELHVIQACLYYVMYHRLDDSVLLEVYGSLAVNALREMKDELDRRYGVSN